MNDDAIKEPEVEYSYNGKYRVIKIDTRRLCEPKIILSEAVILELMSHLKELKNCKIQFGVEAEYVKEEETKTARLSNRAVPYSDTFLNEGIQHLHEKMAVRTELGSKWVLMRILEVFFIIYATSPTSRLSGRSYIPTPPALKLKHAVINVKNEDDLYTLSWLY